MLNDKQIILSALQRERDELHEKIMQVDRIIKKVKGLDYSSDIDSNDVNPLALSPVINQQPIAPIDKFNVQADIKVQVLTVFEILGHAAKMKDIQYEYHKLSGNAFNIREVVRGLNRQRILLMIREKDSIRGVLWVKKEWVRNGVLLDEYKPEGFDMFYQASNLIYE
ncbi:MAG: hypothetical protein ABI675_15400 [Chitinophagaceae bacterium]